jgi:hypothetical protein
MLKTWLGLQSEREDIAIVAGLKSSLRFSNQTISSSSKKRLSIKVDLMNNYTRCIYLVTVIKISAASAALRETNNFEHSQKTTINDDNNRK